MSDDVASGPLDIAMLELLAQRAATHSFVDGWAFEPDRISPRTLVVTLAADQYPAAVESAQLEIRWFEGGDYAVQYLESRGETVWQCRWDRHPKPDAPRAHYHPAPDAGTAKPSPLSASHHLDVLFEILEWVSERIAQVHD